MKSMTTTTTREDVRAEFRRLNTTAFLNRGQSIRFWLLSRTDDPVWAELARDWDAVARERGRKERISE